MMRQPARVYDEVGNVIETHEHALRFTRIVIESLAIYDPSNSR